MDTDLQLLDRYARAMMPTAFTQLVRRHAGMVFAAARRITSDHHDAEEVAQSCFLDLSRQAGSIHGSVAGWLHTVATNRAAMCNRAEGAGGEPAGAYRSPDRGDDGGPVGGYRAMGRCGPGGNGRGIALAGGALPP